MMKHPRCESCKHWDKPQPAFAPHLVTYGYCRRWAAESPMVYKQHYCGEHSDIKKKLWPSTDGEGE